MTERIPQEFVRDFALAWRLTNILPSRFAGAMSFFQNRPRILETREHFHLLAVSAGTGSVRGRREEMQLRPGVMVLLPPELVLRIVPEGGLRLFQFQLELSHSALVPRHPLYLIELPASVRHPSPGSMAGQLRKLEAARAEALSPAGEFETQGCLQGLLARFFSVGFKKNILKPARQIPRWLLMARRIIEESSCRGKVSNARLGAAVGKSVSAIQHGYREHFGISISEAVKRRRIHQAQSILAANRMLTIEHLATRCGYRSRSHFYRDFREVTGRTPGALRGVADLTAMTNKPKRNP